MQLSHLCDLVPMYDLQQAKYIVQSSIIDNYTKIPLSQQSSVNIKDRQKDTAEYNTF